MALGLVAGGSFTTQANAATAGFADRWTGRACVPQLDATTNKLTCGGKTLSYGPDFTTNPKLSAGVRLNSASVQVLGAGQWTGTAQVSTGLSKPNLDVSVTDTGGAQKIRVSWTAGGLGQRYVGNHYKVAVNVGNTVDMPASSRSRTFTLTTGCGVCTAEVIVMRADVFGVKGASVAAIGYKTVDARKTLTSKNTTLATNGAVMYDKTKLRAGVDYTASPVVPTKLDSKDARVRVSGMGRYKGTVTINAIAKAPAITELSITKTRTDSSGSYHQLRMKWSRGSLPAASRGGYGVVVECESGDQNRFPLFVKSDQTTLSETLHISRGQLGPCWVSVRAQRPIEGLASGLPWFGYDANTRNNVANISGQVKTAVR